MKNIEIGTIKYRAAKLQIPQIKILTEFLGVPLRRQPEKKADRVSMLLDLIDRNPEKAVLGWQIIILGEMPDMQTTGNDAMKAVADAEAKFCAILKEFGTQEHIQSVERIFSGMADTLRKNLEAEGKKALAAAAENYRPIVIKSPGKASVKVKGVLPKEFERMVQLGSQRVPICMVGPAGCGKTFLASKLAEALGFSVDTHYADQSMSEGVSESAFTGWLLPTGKGGQFEYVASPFVQIYENGGVFLFDEGDAADANLMVFMNKAIANDGFYLPQRKDKPFVRKHKDFVAVMAMNTFGNGADAQYVGRNQLDAATLDRFRTGMVHMDYSREVETALADGEVYEWAINIRNRIREHGLQRFVSTRVMLDMTKMKQSCDWKLDDFNRTYFADWSESELRTAGLSDILVARRNEQRSAA